MADFDPATGAFIVPWWGAIAILALVVALAVLAVMRAGGSKAMTLLAQFIVVAVVVFVGWSIIDRMNQNERASQRRALDARMEQLTARAMAPGSSLGCLDPVAADALDESCEKALFANPESVASAMSFATAQLTLLSDMIDFEVRHPGSVDQPIASLRRVLERDRYGFVAYVLATRDSCTEDRCETFELFNDNGRVVSNLQGHSFETRLERANAAWAAAKQPQVAAPPPPAAAAAPAASAGAPAHAAASSANFPSASSIPAVSIMNNEPGYTGQNGIDE